MPLSFRSRSKNQTRESSPASISRPNTGKLEEDLLPRTQLCTRCLSVDIPEVLRKTTFDGLAFAQKILRFDWNWSRSQARSCPLCSFLYQVCQAEHPRATKLSELWLCALPSCVIFGYGDGIQYQPDRKERATFEWACTESIPILALLRAIPQYGQNTDVGNNDASTRFSVPTNYIVSTELTSKSSHENLKFHVTAKSPDRTSYDLNVALQWLSGCHKHPGCDVQTTEKPEIKVIDCFTQLIVALPQEAQYLALSYVWGSAQVSKSSLTDVASAPKSIRDAMTVVKSLGHRYLWVDRYCIDQSDQKEKQYQLSTMDRIFEGAFVTIVATSSDVHSGLSGVSIPRTSPLELKLTNCHLMLIRDRLQEKLMLSAWNSRAWTYQEFCLSKRCLFFFPDQVHFLCNNFNLCESTLCRWDARIPTNYRTGIDPRILFKDYDCHDDRPISLHIRAYARRDLTYQEDALDAFRGMLVRCERKSYWGVPLLPLLMRKDSGKERINNPSLELALGLSYSYGDSYDAVDGQKQLKTMSTPTWSWVNSVGPSATKGVFFPTESTLSCTSVEHARFFVKGSDSSLIPFEELCEKNPNSKMLPEQGLALHISCRFFSFKDTALYLAPRTRALCAKKYAESGQRSLSMHWDGVFRVVSDDLYLIELARVFQSEDTAISYGDYRAHFMVVKWIEPDDRAYRIGYWSMSFAREEHAALQPSRRMIKVV